MKTVMLRWLSPRPVRDVHRARIGQGDVGEFRESILEFADRGEFELYAPPKRKRKAKPKAPAATDTEES